MDPAAPAAAPRGLALAQAPALAQINGQEVSGNERETCLWRPWLSSVNDQPRQVRMLVDWAAGGATAAGATKAEFHHPVRLFWPKSRSFDYLYSAGEMLLQNFPVQATINLYEDSNSEEDEEDKEEDEEEEEEVNEIGPEGCARVPEATPHKATAHSPDQPLTCPN
ncbi:protein ripply1 isoform X1 [Peromyscus maniculatus bairdii]|uniref:protein ripply1 isoform X1 n=1 Tax=Peromyscus maniculatus bairdii TaxID=230844 RepID=UPI00042AC4E6|nr:protein ripply1 isoform X1 [Peromyscus maniculatus bairdii]XP_042124652.1 protein ripply1 isoform X1 [Peromyscus maniculatus bairdii]XP_042124653.1 protein ripply1 isoform X1 [Peromyscus maniculatus bairdii]